MFLKARVPLEPIIPSVSQSKRKTLKREALYFRWVTPVPKTPFSRGSILELSQKTSSAQGWTATSSKHITSKQKTTPLPPEALCSSLTSLIEITLVGTAASRLDVLRVPLRRKRVYCNSTGCLRPSRCWMSLFSICWLEWMADHDSPAASLSVLRIPFLKPSPARCASSEVAQADTSMSPALRSMPSSVPGARGRASRRRCQEP